MLDDIDRDLVIRTLLSEAGGEGAEGQAAVAHVIRNRMARGRYGGSSAGEVVTAPNQFEPWNTVGSGAKNDPASYDPNSSAYKAAGKIVDGVFGGEIADPTGGMTHFYAPVAQSALGRDAPKWAKGPSKKIGGHMFFAPDGSISANDLSQGLGDLGQDPSAAVPPIAPMATAQPQSRAGMMGSTSPLAYAPTGGGQPNMQALLRQLLGVGGGGSGFGGNGGGNQHGPINQLLFGPQGWQGRMQQSMPGGLLGALFGGGQQPQPQGQQPMQLPGLGGQPQPQTPAPTAGGPLGNGFGLPDFGAIGAGMPMAEGPGFAQLAGSLFGVL